MCLLGRQLIVFLEAGHATGSGQSSAGLTLNLSSNNPFRNRAPSPAALESPFLNKPASPFDDPPARPLSRNPFLDQVPPPLRSPGVMSTQSDSKSLSAEEIFDSLTLDDAPNNDRPKPPPGPRRPMDRAPPRRGDKPLPPPDGQHRPTRSQEEALRARRMQGAGPPRPSPNSPQRKPQRRPRRNSDSSVMDFDAQPLTEEEKRMIEAKRRERQRRGDGKERSKSGRPSRRMDIIDQLDATSIYGTGVFHHDGPFDALNPHRNRGGSRRAPMQAFPKDSLNNSLGGAGPLNNQADHSAFMGNATDEAFRDYARGGKGQNGMYPQSRAEPAIFDPISRGSIVHGEETHGLGTSTFLEGTPAARSAIVRRQAEQAQENMEGGLGRKKSLAQRIRPKIKGPRDNAPRATGDGGYSRISPEAIGTASSIGSDNNPFFADFSKGEEGFSAKGRDDAWSNNAPTTGRRPSAGLVLERRATTDATSSLDEAPKPTGLLGRMKSLKGGRRPRPDGNSAPPQPGTAV
ncbi:Pal1 cell morphology protein-domain-containing protein [Dactylonectria estremocensis]|uniref:Pal1 cell morphology protein-domain-containing protein n=1 Tax=Dactylonectria estremocensis TaxID=1079267 RepID=A0A9P9JEG6_9HYPO|nr:Pal1 cell morphology protein-domain-containing protein [Dactylonectria estremocensis]